MKIVIIGGGPGGYVAAIRAAQLGAQVHLVEEKKLGGTCLNVGCIPTKALLHTAELYNTVLDGEKIGLITEGVKVNWAGLLKHKDAVVDRLVSGVNGLLKANKVTIHQGYGVLEDNRTVRIEGDKSEKITADSIVISAGSVPVSLRFPGSDIQGVIDSEDALNLPKIPTSLVIIGGGVIGTEFAALYSSLGTKVTVVEMLPDILPPVDKQISDVLKKELTKKGVSFLTDTRMTEVKETDTGLVVKAVKDQKEYELIGEYVLVAVGRKPNVEKLGLEKLGIKTKKGAIEVNDKFETSVPGIYAIGDCNGLTMLAHAASAQGIKAVEHIWGHNTVYNSKAIPYCIYTNPEVASVGITEQEAKRQGLKYKIGVFPLAGNGKSFIEGCEKGLVKIIASEQYKEILGVHIVGPHATELIAEAALAITLEATVDELIATVHAHPTISEAVNEAAHAVIGNAIHWPPG